MTHRTESNLLIELKKSSAGNNGITFIDNTGDHYLPYAELYHKSLRIAGYLKSIVNSSDNELIILLDSNINFVPIFWACIAAKIKAVPISTGTSEEHLLKLFNVWDSLISPYIISSRTIIERIKSYSEQNGFSTFFEKIEERIVLIDDIKETGTYVTEEISATDIAFIQYSSGSTGSPKGVILRHKNLLINIHANIKKLGINSDDSFLSWFPLSHDMGLIGWHIAPIVADINQVLIETSLFVRRPALWMDKATEFKSTVLCTPNFGLKHFLGFTKKLDNADWDLSNVRLIANGAEPISPKLCDTFLKTLKRYNLRYSSMTPGYGLAEIGLIASSSYHKTDFEIIHLDRYKLNIGQRISEIDESSTNCISFVCEGEFIPEMNVRFKDNKGTDLPEEHIGIIYLKGDCVTSGYYNNKPATSKAIRNGWLDTGDLGFLKNNKLYLTGRSKELIIINGFNYYPHDIERVCLSLEGLDLGKVVAAGLFEESLHQEILLIFVYFKGNIDNFIELAFKIKEIVLKSIGLNVFKVVPVKKIPKTTSGKIQRFVLLNNFKQGEYGEILSQIDSKTIAQENINQDNKITLEFVLIKLRDLINQVIKVINIDTNEALVNYGIDSIRGAELLGKIKVVFNIDFDEFIYLPDLSLSSAGKLIFNALQKINLPGKGKPSNSALDNPGRIYETSSGQFSIYYHYVNHSSSSAYNIAIACRILNDVNIEILNQAYNYILSRHEILRAKYFMTDKLYYKIEEKRNCKIDVIEIDADSYNSLKSVIKKIADMPFDIENDSVIRSFMFKTNNYGSIFLVNLHHISGDARSLFILLQEILTSYNELINYGSVKSLTPVSENNYSGYVQHELNYLNTVSADDAKKYWAANLINTDFGLNLTSSVLDNQQTKSSSLIFSVDRNSYKESVNTSDFVFMLTVYCFMLHRYTQQKEIIVGIPVADNRVISNQGMNRELIGYTINTLPIKSIIDYTETVSEYLERMKLTFLNALKYQHYPLTKIVDDINPSRNNSNTVLKTMFTALPVSSTNTFAGFTDSLNEENETEFGGLRLKPFYIPQQESLFDISMEMAENSENTIFRISYNCTKYNKTFIEGFANNYKNVIKEFASSFSTKLTAIEILSNEEKHHLESFNCAIKEYTNYKPIIRLIEEQSAKTPFNIAYIFEGKKYTYDWVNKKANGLADQLLNSGISKGGFIPLFMEKGIDLPVSILAVMKTGCAFIPVDVNSPKRRLKVLINDINPKIILTTKEQLEKLHFVDASKIILADTDNLAEVEQNPGIDISLNDSMYGIYTSGTTGIPKCAINLHKGMTNRFKFMDDYFGLNEERVVFHSANYIFDTSVYQLFWPLTQGAKVIIPKSSDKLNLDYLLGMIENHKVTYIDLVPSVFNILVEYFEFNNEAADKFRSITYLSIGGEAIVPSFVNKFRKSFPDVTITNIYGPTETAIGVTFFNITESADEIPIGKPISNSQIFILDNNMKPVPVGITGEIYIGGQPVGSGYLNDPYKTDAVFVHNPFNESGKLYKTGDLGCYLTDGNILFKGRTDEQIKIRGVRIEPDEIRVNIIKVDFVSDALVVANENANGEIQLAAYVVYKNGSHNEEELKQELLRYLPEIYIPQDIIEINEIPLNANGKVDKQALPKLSLVYRGLEGDTTPISSSLLNIWREVLGRNEIGTNEKFFDCGGNSLTALLLKIKIRQIYGIELGIELILNNPSISRLSEIIIKLIPEKRFSIPKIEDREYYPLSNQQKRMWLMCSGEIDSGAYSMIGVFHITGKVDLALLCSSWKMLVDRHESLRTRFIVMHGEPVQTFNAESKLDYKVIHTNNIYPELQNTLEQEKRYFFNLSEPPLFKIIIITDGGENTKLVLHFHHIVSDGWSTKIILKELSFYYNNLIHGNSIRLEELPIQNRDYCAWLESEEARKLLLDAENYWSNKLSGNFLPTSVPMDCDNPPKKKRCAGVKRFFLLKNKHGITVQFCRKREITLFMLLISGVDIVLSKYTGSNEIVLGTPVSGRGQAELESQIGLYVNTLVLRNKVSEEKSYMEFIDELKHEILESYKYQDYPYDKLIESKGVSKDGNLFELFVSFEGTEDEITLDLGGTEYIYEEVGNEESKFNISLIFREKANGVELLVEYAKDLYKDERIELLASHIENVLEEVITNPDKNIGSIEILSKAEKEKLLHVISTSGNAGHKWISFIEQFNNTVKEFGYNIAVCHQNKSLTYKQLDIYSDKVALALMEKGIKEECIVGLITTKSPDLIIGIMGILKAGAAYLPLDPGHPSERSKLILKESGCKVILTNVNGFANNSFNCETLNIPYLISNINHNDIPVKAIDPSQLAYVIYTSGSTGSPKGVMIEHHSLNNLIDSLRSDVYDNFGKGLNVALQASQIFDASIQQIFPALVRGDTLHLIDDEIKLDGKLTSEYFIKHRINIADATPTLFDYQIRSGFAESKCDSLKQLLIGGEPLSYELLNSYYKNGLHDNVIILNMYGPTECCVDTVSFTINKEDCHNTGIVPIGHPMLNTKSYILDKNLQLVPKGITGELYLSGNNIGRGYINNKDFTDSKFVQSPFGINSRLYRTGDLCSYLYDGNIIYLGRIDNQIKIRGYRVEPGEIESVIEHFVEGSKCIVIFNKNEEELTAFLEKGNKSNLSLNSLFNKFRSRLPAYMWPSKFVEIDKFPLTPSGKPNRNLLTTTVKDYKSISLDKYYESPRNETEKILTDIWKSILGLEDIGINDNFYELGGHSLKSLKIMSAIVKTFGVEIGYKDILGSPTIKDLASIIRQHEEAKYIPIPKIEEKEYYNLSHAQKRIWLECELGKNAAYNIAGGFRIKGELNELLLNESFEVLFNRHDSLRTGFRIINGEPKQVINPSPTSIVSIIDLSTLDNAEVILQNEIKKATTKSLNIFSDNLSNILLFRIKENERFLLAVFHHILTDGWSIKLMLDELGKIYTGLIRGLDIELNHLSIQYKDFSAWSDNVINSPKFRESIKYWNNKISGKLPDLFIPSEKKQGESAKSSGKIKRIQLNRELTESINNFAVQKEVTPFIFVLSIVEIVFHKYTNSNDIILGTPVSGRNHPDLEQQLGLYINTLVLRNNIHPKQEYSTFLKELKTEVLESYSHQDYPFDMLIEESGKRNPTGMFNLLVSYETIDNAIRLNLDGIEVNYIEIDTGTSKFDLSLTFREKYYGLELIIEYSSNLYDDKIIEILGRDIINIINSVINNDSQTIEIFKVGYTGIYQKTYVINNSSNTKVIKDKYKAPRSKVEKEIADLWIHVLNIKRVGLSDNFFELGGQSIKALQLVTLLKDKYNLNLELIFVFSSQTILEQAREINNIIWIGSDKESDNGMDITI